MRKNDRGRDPMSERGVGMRWGGVIASAVATVSWAYLAMVAVAALGLHLMGADEVGALGPMTAAATALAVGGQITPTGEVGMLGMDVEPAQAAVSLTPLGVSLAGALVLGWLFVRSLRQAGAFISGTELAARAGTVVVLFTALLGGLVWAGSGSVTIDGAKLPVGGQAPGGGVLDELPGGIGDELGGGLEDALGDLAQADAKVGFDVDAAPTIVAGLLWVLVVLLISLAASRTSPLPRGWEALHRTVRPAASALRMVVVLAVAAGGAAAAYAAVTEDAHGLIAGSALIGAPNGVWLAIPLGLFVPFHGAATGQLKSMLPSPMDELLSDDDKPITLSRLAELDGRVWLLALACALMMLSAGVVAAARTPRSGSTGSYVGQCAVRLGAVAALTLPLLVFLTEVSADASLSVFGFDAVGAGVELQGNLLMALLLGALWGAGTGAVGAVLAVWTGAAGGRAAPLALDSGATAAPVPAPGGPQPSGRTYPSVAYRPGPYNPSGQPSAPGEANPYAAPSGDPGPRNPDTPNPYGANTPGPYGRQTPNPYASPSPPNGNGGAPPDLPTMTGPPPPPPPPPGNPPQGPPPPGRPGPQR
ncbi:streptophobe family protein [Streptomyces sp. NPDC051940]|uniref:streptophobe family protein n=1 Tax=Streptomyces sp. NPDC051940 TaxID=3155675 RepID=UPI00341ABB99